MESQKCEIQYNFDHGKHAHEIPALAKHQADNRGKTRISLYIDTDILDAFRERADAAGYGYEPMMNAALRKYLERESSAGKHAASGDKTGAS